MKNGEWFDKPYEISRENEMRLFWQEARFYEVKRDENKEPYTMVIPPPNVTGDLHVGHMLNNTIQDVIIRWQRGLGKAACWIPGTDHASIATEAKVLKVLKDQGIEKKDLSREEFLGHAWKWADTYRGRIVDVLKTLGVSCDWSREAFTMSPEYYDAVIKAFVKLYKDGLVYKGYRLVNWCPASKSVISDEEVFFEEKQGSLWHIRYPIVGEENTYLMVATTRPETLFGDQALAVHPSDERYTHLIGKKVHLPCCGRTIPVIADEYPDPAFGTGVVKITPAHDPNDYLVGQRHQLPMLNIMNPDASMNDHVSEKYRGMDRYVARKALVADIEKAGLLEKIEPYKLNIGISQRGLVPIEYYLSEQWYIRMEPLAKLALEATHSGKVELIPHHMNKTWDHWLNNIQDWCVSRQLWWGHRIPIYTCQKCGLEMCEEKAPTVCPKCKSTDIHQEEDVLDTWASSWLWPFAVHNWANPTEENLKDLEYFYPTNTLVTAADIIFFWVARMVMAGEYFCKKTPFSRVYFHGLVRDEYGKKISKSLGNGPDAHKLLEQYGTDAIRFAITHQITIGNDISWKNESCEIGRNFINKLWNSARFLTMNCSKLNVDPKNSRYEDIEKIFSQNQDPLYSWILAEFHQALEGMYKAHEDFEFSTYAAKVYEFCWMKYCDWFIELAKPRFSHKSEISLAEDTLRFALSLFDSMLRMTHAVVPHVTECIWQNLFAKEVESVGLQRIPLVDHQFAGHESVKNMQHIQEMVNAIRVIRGRFSIHPGAELQVCVEASQSVIGHLLAQGEFLAKAKFNFEGVRPSFSATAMTPSGVTLHVNLEGFVDKSAEKTRLQKGIEKLQKGLASSQAKLANTTFVESAPAQVVAGVRATMESQLKELEILEKGLKDLG